MNFLTFLQTVDANQFNVYLLMGYSAMWLIGLIYVITLVNRQRNLQQDIKLMRQLLEEDEDNPTS